MIFAGLKIKTLKKRCRPFEEKVQAFNYFSIELLIIIEHKTQEILHCVFEEVRTKLVLKQEMNKSAWKSKDKVEKQTHDRN